MESHYLRLKNEKDRIKMCGVDVNEPANAWQEGVLCAVLPLA